MREKKLTAWLADVAIRRRLIVYVVFAVLTIGGLVLAGNLGVVADPEELLGDQNPTAQQFFEVTNAFGFTSSLIVVVEGENRNEMVEAAHRVHDRITANPELRGYFSTINLRNDPEYALRWGLMLARDIDGMSDTMALLEQRSIAGLLTVLNDSLETTVLSDEERFTTNQDQWSGLAALSSFENLTIELATALGGPEGIQSEEHARAVAESIVQTVFAGEPYTWSPNQDMLTFSLIPAFEMDDFDALYASVGGVDEIVKQVSAEMTGVELSIGGEVAWGVARHEGVNSDTLMPTLIALVFILVLFFFSFTRMRKMVLAIIALAIGIIITMGAIEIVVGHISMITAIFAVILLGLGIDFAIHLVSNYDDFRLKGLDPTEAMKKTMETGGAPIFLGGITTACAFFSLGFASSPAIREFGIVCGLGVVITLVTMLLLFPALMLSFGGKKTELKRAKWRPMINFSFMGGLGRKIESHPWVALVAIVVLTGISIWAIPKNVVDYDPMNNSPRNHPYTMTQRTIIEKMEISPFISFAKRGSVEEARELAEQFRRAPLVARVASVADLLPPENEIAARLAVIAAGETVARDVQHGAGNPTGNPIGVGAQARTPVDVGVLADEVQRLEWNVIEMGDLAVAGMGEDNLVVRRRNAMIREILGAETGAPGREVFQKTIAAIEADPAGSAQRLAYLDAALSSAMEAQQARMLVDRAPTVADLPTDIRRGMISLDGTEYLISVVPTAAAQGGSDTIMEFHSSLTEIDPGLTGSVPLYVALVSEIFTEASRAGVYVAIAVFLLLFIIFRNLKHVVLAFLMVAFGIVWMFGILPLTGTHLSLMAGLVFPLLIGMGTDCAMHILHRYRHEGNKIVPAIRYSGKAVLLTTVTTMLAFGSLAVAGEMATIAAIGALLFVGLGTCFIATVIALPALLTVSDKLRKNTGVAK